MDAMLRATGVAKKLGSFRLGPVDLLIEPGLAMGFIGPNGAGKTTTIHCLLGLLRPEGGRIEVAGREAKPDAADWKADVGFVLNGQGFYERLTVAKNLAFFASFYPDWDQAWCEEIARRLQLDGTKKVKTLSTGDRQKLAVTAALAHRPKLLIMDEPTSGLDPLARAELMTILHEHLRDGEKSILMSTHILADVSAVADRLTFIGAGKIVETVNKDDLVASWRRISYRAVGDVFLPGVVQSERDGTMVLVTTRDGDASMAALKAASAEVIAANRLSLDDISVHILKGAGR